MAQDKFIFEPPQIEVNLGESKTVIVKLVNDKNNLVESSFSMYSAHDPGVGPTPDWPGTSLSKNSSKSLLAEGSAFSLRVSEHEVCLQKTRTVPSLIWL